MTYVDLCSDEQNAGVRSRGSELFLLLPAANIGILIWRKHLMVIFVHCLRKITWKLTTVGNTLSTFYEGSIRSEDRGEEGSGLCVSWEPTSPLA